MKKLERLLMIIVASCYAFSHAGATISSDGEKSPISYVNPFVGTSNFGTTNPGAVCPNGMMSVSPFNVSGSKTNKWDKDSRWWSTPYTSENSYFTGFSHVNLSGVGCPEAGSVIIMPTTGELEVDYRKYGSEYDRETANPGYYANRLTRYDINTEVSATPRTSIERFTFHEGKANILVNLGLGLTNESGSWVRRVSDTEIEGMRFAGTFCYNPQAVFPIYFFIRINKSPDVSGFWKKQPEMTAEAAWDKDSGKYKIYTNYTKEIAGDDIGCWFTYNNMTEGEQVTVQVGISFVSSENARINLEAEQKNTDFDSVRAAAGQAWADDLGRIMVRGGSEEHKRIFYTALYHTLIHPSILNDVNGEYPLMEGGSTASHTGKVEDGHNRYTVFSLWDTYRNVHQLLTLLFPKRQEDMLRSMVDMYKEWGWLPKWELFGRETFTMEGDPAIPVIADSWLKGLHNFDIKAAYEACIKSATTPGNDNLMRPDIDPYIEKGYIPLGYYAADFSGDNSVSHALEYYVADNALSLLARDLAASTDDGKYTEDAILFRNRSLGYRNYYSPESGTLRPLTKEGKFLSPFDPKQGENFEPVPGFHEGSAWNYTFYVPHDVEGYARLMGGSKAFVSKLQRVFDDGLYDPANEPDIAYPYLFSRFKGEEWRTQKTVSMLIDKYFTNRPDGLPGNDDTGTMSAWLVFSMLGFYPDCPGEPFYTLTTPAFDNISIRIEPEYCNGNNLLEIQKTPGGRILSVSSAGKHLKNYRISHKQLTESKLLKFKCK